MGARDLGDRAPRPTGLRGVDRVAAAVRRPRCTSVVCVQLTPSNDPEPPAAPVTSVGAPHAPAESTSYIGSPRPV